LGYGKQHTCKYSYYNNEKLNYIESRKILYEPLYCKLVKKEEKFKKLEKQLAAGKNLLIIEVDGPHQEDLEYYKTNYNVSDNFIENNTMLATANNLNIMMNDPKHPYGHGYCLARALLKN